jgi:cell division protein FtsN
MSDLNVAISLVVDSKLFHFMIQEIETQQKQSTSSKKPNKPKHNKSINTFWKALCNGVLQI